MPHQTHTRTPALLLLALAAVALAVAACDGSGGTSFDNFNVEVKDQTVVPRASALEVLLGSFPQLDGFTQFDLTEQADFKNSKYSPEDVDSVTLTSFTMRVVTPDSQDLSFLGGMVLHLETQGLPRKEIARRDSFPDGQRSVAFTTTKDDLKDWVLARESRLTVEVTDSRRPPQDTTVEVIAIFDVDVRVF